MRIFLVLIFSFALASLALGAQEEKKKEQPKKKGAQAGQVSQPAAKATGKPAKAGKTAEARKPAETGNAAGAGVSTGKGKGKGKPAEADQAAGTGEATAEGKPAGGGKKTGAGKPGEVATATTGSKGAAKGKPFKPQKFNLANKQPKPEVAPPVKFQQNRRIEGSQNWKGAHYTVFRTYTPQWHDQVWWKRHHNRIVFVYGGWYYWNAGWWYPAWGYAPNAYYAYDGPIYAYNDLPPDQVIANVQAALQQQGYYHGEVDGLLGPLTREAITGYQRDHALYETAAIDQPTLESLGMA
jgi:hypothetical protein